MDRKVKVNHLKRLISSLRILLWLIHAGCFPHPHVGTDIVVGRRDTRDPENLRVLDNYRSSFELSTEAYIQGDGARQCTSCLSYRVV